MAGPVSTASTGQEQPPWPVNADPSDIPLDTPVDILCSFHYFKDMDMAEVRSWGTRIIGDSGAFSAFTSGGSIDREEFHQWAATWGDDLFWTASLDVLGDARTSLANWKAAKADGLNLVPTVHYGEPPTTLDPYIEEGADFIGLGGMVGYASEADRLMRWLIPMFRHVRDHHPHVRFHGWGISHPRLVDRLPWWSTDSSGFSSAFRFGTLRLFDPRRGVFVGVDLNGRDLARYRHVLATHYGIEDWRSVAVSTPATRRPLGRVAIRAVQLYGRWLSERQKVRPPASLVPRLALYGGVNEGPVEVAAGKMSTGSSLWPLVPPDRGPRQVSALGASDTSALFGPRQVSAVGDPTTQPYKALGPIQSMVMFPKVGQIEAIEPSPTFGPKNSNPN